MMSGQTPHSQVLLPAFSCCPKTLDAALQEWCTQTISVFNCCGQGTGGEAIVLARTQRQVIETQFKLTEGKKEFYGSCI